MSKRRMKYHSNDEISYYNFLHSMKDKIVTVYRGGPESKKGKLTAVKSDYIALQAEKKIIYYQLDHVKSITEDTNNSTTTIETEEMPDADDFHSLIGQLMNQSVQFNQGGPESKKGRLVWLGDDYAALNTNEDGVVYFNIHHIKSISKHEPDLKIEGQTPSGVLEADYLSEVFKSLTHKWVSINRGGPEAIEGILVDNADGHYTIVKNQEVLRIYPFHIKSISLGPKGSYKKEDEKNEHQNQEDSDDTDQKEEVYSSSLISSKPYSSSSSSKSSKRSLKSSDYQSSKSYCSSSSRSSSKSSKRSSKSSDHQSSKSYSSSGSKSSSKSSKRSPRSSDYQSSKSYSSSGSKSSSKSSKRSPRSSDYQSSRSPGYSSSLKSSGKQKEDYSYETIVRTIDYHWKRKF
ncbi:spore coat protein CotH [Bacillus subtilis]|uniref:spore coat protein CotH n=1 Tax=Bacillus subtilis TaxID=1423 RepID=UPI00203A6740|nr:spore coat protein CotH [Bacillus subtilis]MCM3013347.1 spore coat protein CotH [Bacillus subtilis]MCM3523989.1 spore coat protein CotH [Bacillus subtilis]